MRGKAIGLVIVVLALLLLATPGLVAARGGHGGGGQGGASFNLQGTIDSKSCDEENIAVQVTEPLYLVSDDPLTVLLTSDTRIKQCDPDEGSKRISCSDLVVGAEVKVAGLVIDDDYVANSVIQGWVPPPEE